MSFGSAASPLTAPDAPCPCGSGSRFAECCGPLLAGAPAPDAERLMRSRYVAFHEGDITHLERSWHPRTRPPQIHLDPPVTWLRLDVDEVEQGEDTATVTFRAHWQEGRERGVLAERSRFAKRGGRWFYLEPDVNPEGQAAAEQ